MKKLFSWLSDTGGWIALVIIVPLFLFMFIAPWTNWNNFYSRNCQAAGLGWRFIGLAIFALGILLETKLKNGFNPFVGFIILALTWCAFAGFNFSIA